MPRLMLLKECKIFIWRAVLWISSIEPNKKKIFELSAFKVNNGIVFHILHFLRTNSA